MPVADHDVTSAGSIATPAISAAVVRRHRAGHPGHEVDVHPPAERQPVGVEQPAQGVHVAEVEQLELRHHLALLRLHVEVAHEPPGVEEHVVAEVGRAAGERARVGLGVEHGEPLLERVVHRAAGRQLHHEVGLGAQRVDRGPQPPGIQGRPVLVVADVQVDERGARPPRSAAPSRRARRASSAAAAGRPWRARRRWGRR